MNECGHQCSLVRCEHFFPGQRDALASTLSCEGQLVCCNGHAVRRTSNEHFPAQRLDEGRGHGSPDWAGVFGRGVPRVVAWASVFIAVVEDAAASSRVQTLGVRVRPREPRDQALVRALSVLVGDGTHRRDVLADRTTFAPSAHVVTQHTRTLGLVVLLELCTLALLLLQLP